MPVLGSIVNPVHFEDFDGHNFERLVFAYHCRREEWQSLEWYGQVGADLGRDIWGVSRSSESICIQCVNRSSLTLKKVQGYLAKIARAPLGIPDRFRIVTRSQVSAPLRDKIQDHA